MLHNAHMSHCSVYASLAWPCPPVHPGTQLAAKYFDVVSVGAAMQVCCEQHDAAVPDMICCLNWPNDQLGLNIRGFTRRCLYNVC